MAAPRLPQLVLDQYRCYYYGIVSSIILFGLMMSQSWNFFNYSAKGGTPRRLQSFVAYLVCSATVTTAIHIAITDFYLIEKAGDPTSLADPGQYELTLVSLLLLAINTLLVQCFFGYQVWTVTGGTSYRAPVVVTIVIMAIISCATSLVSLGMVWKNQALIQAKNISILVGVNAAASTLADLFAAIALSLFLHTSRTGFKGTNQIINTIVFYTMQRGVLLTLCQVMVFIAKIAFPDSSLFLTFDMCLGKLYVNTILSILNAKASLRGRDGRTTYSGSESFALPQVKSQTHQATISSFDPPAKSGRMEIIVSSERDTHQDEIHSSGWKGQGL